MSLPRHALVGLAALLLTGCAPAGPPSGPALDPRAAPSAAAPPSPTRPPVAAARPAPPELPRRLPGVGPQLAAALPAGARQALVVTGDGPDSSTGHAVLYRDDGDGWLAGPTWPTRNALRGCTTDHHVNDLRSPVGAFTLSDAGGSRPDPGSRLPYNRSGAFTISGTGFEDEPLAGSFDYVVAVDYNRVPGSSPLDPRRPRGGAHGGDIWLHVDHGGPTHGCVSMSEDLMRELLLALDPALHPVVVMADGEALAR